MKLRQRTTAKRSDKGFTLVELLVVVAIIATIGVVSIMNLQGSRNGTDFNNTTKQIGSILRQAQSQAASDYQGVPWGVHFANTTTSFYALFSSSTYSSATVANRYLLPSSVGMTLVSSGLVGYWPFNEGSGNTVRDYSGNGNTGS